jgi:hypothetical protein
MGNFFKSAFSKIEKKIEDNLARPTDKKQQSKQEEEKAQPGPFALPPA